MGSTVLKSAPKFGTKFAMKVSRAYLRVEVG
jgi:hypothetical protein